MFENGSLKNIFSVNGELNQNALDVWTKKRQAELEKQKYRVARTQSQNIPIDEDDVF